jgi:hypothetical protein
VPSGQRSRVTGLPAQVRQHHGSDARVVVDHLGLGGAGGGIEHLVEVAQTQATPADVDHLR